MGKSQVTIYLKGRGEINIDGRGHCESNSPGLSYVLLEKQKICKVRKLFLTVL